MRISSAKAKGRKACAEAKDEILKYLPLESDDIQLTSSSVTGKDLRLSPKARALLPFVFEVKNQESLNVWESYRQAEDHWSKEISREEVYPALIYRRNRSELMIAMSLEDFLHFNFKRGKNEKSVQASEPNHEETYRLP